MATNSIGKGKKNVSVTMPEELATKIAGLARESEMSRNEYCASVLEDAADRKAKVDPGERKIIYRVKRQRRRRPNPDQGEPPKPRREA